MDTEPALAGPGNLSSNVFNATYKLAARFLGIPSRVLARMRRLDDIFDYAAQHQHDHDAPDLTSLPNGYATSAPKGTEWPPRGYYRERQSSGSSTARSGSGGTGSGLSVPGPWGFLTSGYFIGVVIMVSTSHPEHHRKTDTLCCVGVSPQQSSEHRDAPETSSHVPQPRG